MCNGISYNAQDRFKITLHVIVLPSHYVGILSSYQAVAITEAFEVVGDLTIYFNVRCELVVLTILVLFSCLLQLSGYSE